MGFVTLDFNPTLGKEAVARRAIDKEIGAGKIVARGKHIHGFQL